MKTLYKANDGTIFDTEEECLAHEKDSGLYQLICGNISYEYNDDAALGIIEEINVQMFIVEHFEAIAECLGYDIYKRN